MTAGVLEFANAEREVESQLTQSTLPVVNVLAGDEV